MTLLFRSYAGSILHGLATSSSDIDIFEVYSEGFGIPSSSHELKREIQTIKGKDDVTKITLSRFMQRSMEGSHQCLDAMFSSIPEVDKISALRKSFYCGNNTVETFRRSIREMAFQKVPKKRRHAVRVTLNLIQIMERGRYEPQLTDEEKKFTDEISRLPIDEFYVAIQKLSPINLSLTK